MQKRAALWLITLSMGLSLSAMESTEAKERVPSLKSLCLNWLVKHGEPLADACEKKLPIDLKEEFASALKKNTDILALLPDLCDSLDFDVFKRYPLKNFLNACKQAHLVATQCTMAVVVIKEKESEKISRWVIEQWDLEQDALVYQISLPVCLQDPSFFCLASECNSFVFKVFNTDISWKSFIYRVQNGILEEVLNVGFNDIVNISISNDAEKIILCEELTFPCSGLDKYSLYNVRTQHYRNCSWRQRLELPLQEQPAPTSQFLKASPHPYTSNVEKLPYLISMLEMQNALNGLASLKSVFLTQKLLQYSAKPPGWLSFLKNYLWEDCYQLSAADFYQLPIEWQDFFKDQVELTNFSSEFELLKG